MTASLACSSPLALSYRWALQTLVFGSCLLGIRASWPSYRRPCSDEGYVVGPNDVATAQHRGGGASVEERSGDFCILRSGWRSGENCTQGWRRQALPAIAFWTPFGTRPALGLEAISRH